MGVYTYNYTVFYNDTTNALVSQSAATFQLDDDGNGGVGNGNDIFESGETVFNGFATYLGTIIVGGVKGVAIQLTGQIGVYLPVAPTSAVETTLPAITTEDLAFCFSAGTCIATETGETVVGELTIGDRIQTAEGHTVPVKWVGRQTLSEWHHGSCRQPVRIRAGALGDALPHTDLTVTADHGMVINDLVINASALVNGDTIDFVPMSELDDSFTVYHIETEAHDIILANGAPSETFIDAAGRAAFDNHQEYLDLYGAERIIPEMTMPRISSARLVPQAIKARIGIGKASRAA